MLGRLFDRQPSQSVTPSQAAMSGPKVPRHSGGWGTLRKRLLAEPGLRVLDVGATSATNINLLTNLGHSVYQTDLIHDAYSGEWKTAVDEEGNPAWNVEAFSRQNLDFSGRKFDMVLLWTTLDYLPEPLVAPVVDALWEAVTPGGQLLAVFNMRMQPEQSPQYRFHLTLTDDVELQLAQPVPLQRALTNRKIERLFERWSGLKQFLAKDGVSEAIMIR
jgi:SAM-dependent methyltransferase